MLSTDTWLKIICSMMVNAVIFGVGVVTVLLVPAFAAQAKYLIPAIVVVSFVITPLVASHIARRMRLRNWGREGWKDGDAISG